LELVEGDDGEFVTKVLGDSLETFTGGDKNKGEYDDSDE
jgi:hypothetical protein